MLTIAVSLGFESLDQAMFLFQSIHFTVLKMEKSSLKNFRTSEVNDTGQPETMTGEYSLNLEKKSGKTAIMNESRKVSNITK